MLSGEVLNLKNWTPHCPGIGHQGSYGGLGNSMHQGESLQDAGPYPRAVAAIVNMFP